MKKISEGEIKAVVSNDSWQEEFEKQFINLVSIVIPKEIPYKLVEKKPQVKSFIKKTLADERVQVRKKVVEMIEEYDRERIGKYLEDKNNAKSSNEVVLDIINNLKEL